jgi:small subunit ribosomal protein S6
MSKELMHKYETIVVTRTDAGHEAQKRLYDKVTEQMEKGGARHIRFELWGKRRLAYEVNKATKGLFMYYVYLGGGTFVRDLQRTLKLSNIVLRYLTVRLAEGIDPDTYDFEKEKQFDALPTDADDGHDHGRSTTGWDSEFSGRDWKGPAGSEEEEEEGGDEPKSRRGHDEDDEEEV